MVAAYSRYSYVGDRSPRSRIVAAVLAVAIVLLLLLALLRLGAFQPVSQVVQRSLSTFTVGRTRTFLPTFAPNVRSRIRRHQYQL